MSPLIVKKVNLIKIVLVSRPEKKHLSRWEQAEHDRFSLVPAQTQIIRRHLQKKPGSLLATEMFDFHAENNV